MPLSVTPVANLRRAEVLPFVNPRTMLALLVLSFLGLNVTLRLLQRETALRYLYVLMLVQVTPMVIAFTRRHFTYLSFIMFNHFATLSLAKLNVLLAQPNIEVVNPVIRTAIQEQIFCSLILILVYYAFRMLVFQGVAEKERFQELILTRRQLLLLGAYVALVPLFISKLPAWFLIIHFMLLSADLLLLFTCRSPGNEWLMRVFKGVAVALSMKYFLDSGMLTMLGGLITLFMFTGAMRRDRRSLVLAVALTVLVASIQSVKGEFRVAIHGTTQLNTSERIDMLTDLLQTRFVGGEKADVDTTWEGRWTSLLAGFARAGDDSMERVLALTPSKVPFWGGESYASIPFMFIPRFLWPDKPSRHFWNKYGRLYGVLSSDDFQTSVGVSYFAEGYMNFGYSGMYAVALLVGFLIALTERMSYLFLRGYFYFSFMLFLLPLLPAATDLGSLINSLFLYAGMSPFMRSVFLSMAQRDEYT